MKTEIKAQLKESAKKYIRNIFEKYKSEENDTIDNLVSVIFIYIDEAIKEHEIYYHENNTKSNKP